LHCFVPCAPYHLLSAYSCLLHTNGRTPEKDQKAWQSGPTISKTEYTRPVYLPKAAAAKK